MNPAASRLYVTSDTDSGTMPSRSLTFMVYIVGAFETVGRANLGIVCGLTNGGGGEVVLAADACAAVDIEVTAIHGQDAPGTAGPVGQPPGQSGGCQPAIGQSASL